MDDVEPTFVLLKADDYARYPAPKWARATDAWESQYIARQKLRPILKQQFDVLLVNSWEFVTAFRHLARRMPAAALMDAVPGTVDAQLRRRGYGGWRRSVAQMLHHRPFGRAAREFSYFLPMGSDCADALERDYGIPRERCLITLAPQDLDRWTPGIKKPSSHLRLLFVANDFVRKGGDFLLQLFRERLADKCTLTIASNDRALESRQLPPGVIWERGRNREQLLEIYRDSDLFLFPTQQDYMPQVLAEALTTGVPCMANDVGGIRDLVRNGETGFLMSRNAPRDAWAEKIEHIHSHPAELNRLSAAARSFAEKNLDIRRFDNIIGKVLERLNRERRLGG